MRTFLLIWFGQLISLIGSGLTSFALRVWLYQTTGSSVQFSLMYVARISSIALKGYVRSIF